VIEGTSEAMKHPPCWQNNHPVDAGLPHAPLGLFETIEAALAAFQATP
jgi:hypothetical protein